MNWDTGTWDSGTWDQPSDYFSPQPKLNNRTKMKRTNYYPSRIGDQLNWLDNYAVKLPIHGPTLGVIAGDITASVNDAKYANYVLGTWLSAVRNFSPSTTDAVDDVLTGAGTVAMVLPTFTAPALPAGVTAALPGTLNRIFALIAKMKLSSAMTEAIATDLGIVGSEATEKTVPKFLTEMLQGSGCQCVKLTFYKYNHMGVYIEGRCGTGAWEFLAIDTESPYIDERPLLAAGTPEVREYRMRFWDKGTPNGDWTDVVKVTVSPYAAQRGALDRGGLSLERCSAQTSRVWSISTLNSQHSKCLSIPPNPQPTPRTHPPRCAASSPRSMPTSSSGRRRSISPSPSPVPWRRRATTATAWARWASQPMVATTRVRCRTSSTRWMS